MLGKSLAFFGAMGATALLHAQEAPTPPAPEMTDLAAGQDQSLRLTVPVMVNGQGPFQFVIDTGADRTVISTELARKLALPTDGKMRVHAMSGPGSAKSVKVDSIQVANRTIRNIKTATFPEFNLGGVGLLGIDALKNLRVTMDFEKQTVVAEPSSAPPPPALKNSDTIVVTARTRLGQLVMVDADANGEKVWVVVDTGAQNSIGNSKLRRSLVIKKKVGTPKPITLIDVLGKTSNADYAFVENLRIGGIKMQNAAIAFSDVHTFRLFELERKPAMLLGMESLRAFRRVTIDFATRKVTFVLPSA